MTIVWNLIKAFLVGGALCMIGDAWSKAMNKK